MRIEENRISIIGLGYVGLPLAVEFGKTFKVIGYDINEDRVKELIAGHDSTLEINSKQLLDSKGLSFSHNESYLDLTDIFIITVPKPVE